MDQIEISSLALAKLCEYFKKTGWPEYMDELKLRERMYISDEQYKKGWVIVEIERHKGLMNEVYVKGAPMLNFETYLMRYAVDLESDQVESLDVKVVDRQINLDDAIDNELHDWSIEIHGNTKKTIELSNSLDGSELKYTSLSKAKIGISEMIHALDYGPCWQELSDDEIDEFKNKLSARLYLEVCKAWKNAGKRSRK